MKSPAMISLLQRKLAGALVSLCAALMANGALADNLRPQLQAQQNDATADLERWYGSVVDDCGDPSRPAYQCSGILLRATGTKAGSLPWEPSDRQIAKGSVSFSWVRQDVGFAKPFDRHNGFILYPNQAVPDGKLTDLKIRCSFPINANTNNRQTLQGCGPFTGHEQTTDTCQNLGLLTARQWLDRYPQADNARVCGWALDDAHGSRAAEWFRIAAEAHQGLADALWATNNEVLVSVWPKGSDQLPLHSFFYVPSEWGALVKAQHDQIQYHQRHGQVIPIVKLGFPGNREGSMSFAYDVYDQAIGRPVRTGFVDFEDAAVGPQQRVTAAGIEFLLGGDRGQVSDRPHPASHGLIRSRHISVDSTISFSLQGPGRRRVAFSWGCNRLCALQKVVADEHILLQEEETGEMHYGFTEFVIDGPEAFILVIASVEDDIELVIDNLDVQELPALIHTTG